MTTTSAILAIDQGTTSSRAIVFDRGGKMVALAQKEFRQIFPQDGWVEHDPEEIWSSTLETSREAFKAAEDQGFGVEAIGISNQRETTIVWDRQTGKPIYNAIVWQDRRTADLCDRLKQEGIEDDVRERTGLLLDPYFSASKIAWILDHVEKGRARAEKGELAFGTVDSFLIWRLTGGRRHVTDATNASRTSLFNIRKNDWDDALVDRFRVARELLPEVLDNAAEFGKTDAPHFGRPIPICGVAGDQQAASFGQAVFKSGAAKCTYGTGGFLLAHTGDAPVLSKNNLVSTIGYRLGGRTAYAIEGSIFVAGAAIQWLRDQLGLIDDARESETLAASVSSAGGVYLVPGFTGLGAPYWRADARASIVGLSRGTGRAEIVRAALEAVAYQTHDLIEALAADCVRLDQLRVDGGMSANKWMLQFLADTLNIPIVRPAVTETTALGVAYFAGLKAGLYDGIDEIAELWTEDIVLKPSIKESRRIHLLEGWKRAVAQTLL